MLVSFRVILFHISLMFFMFCFTVRIIGKLLKSNQYDVNAIFGLM